MSKKTVTLELTTAQAETLWVILRRIGGDYSTSRKHADKVYDKLDTVLGQMGRDPWKVQSRHPVNRNHHIYFGNDSDSWDAS